MAMYFCSGALRDEKLFRHYALNVPLYTHFTSPIRRYADVIVHRLLAASLSELLWCFVTMGLFCCDERLVPGNLPLSRFRDFDVGRLPNIRMGDLVVIFDGLSRLLSLCCQIAGQVWVSQERKFTSNLPNAMTRRPHPREFKS